MKGITYYTEKIPGSRGNYGWVVSFDKTDGYVRITQGIDQAEALRVLLSPKQIDALFEFVARRKRTTRKRQ